MDSVLCAVIEVIHCSPAHVVLCLYGGAAQALGWLLSVPGASRTVLEATIPNSRASMVELLGKVPTQFVRQETADEIAKAAFNRALKLSMPGVQVVGIGFTGPLASEPPNPGDHRCYVSARTQIGLWRYGLILAKFGFNLGEGGLPCYEISAINADKPPLGLSDIKERLKQFHSGRTLVVTNQPYFYKKAELFPDSTFVVGVDTALRLVDPKYYGNSKDRMLEVMEGIKRLGCDFLVAGRTVGGGFQVLSDVQVPDEIQSMFQEIPEFRVDLSSTQLRQAQQK